MSERQVGFTPRNMLSLAACLALVGLLYLALCLPGTRLGTFIAWLLGPG